MTTTGTKRRCPGCGRTNIGRQDNCLACDTPLGREEPAPQPQTAARPKFCTACGAPWTRTTNSAQNAETGYDVFVTADTVRQQIRTQAPIRRR